MLTISDVKIWCPLDPAVEILTGTKCDSCPDRDCEACKDKPTPAPSYLDTLDPARVVPREGAVAITIRPLTEAQHEAVVIDAATRVHPVDDRDAYYSAIQRAEAFEACRRGLVSPCLPVAWRQWVGLAILSLTRRVSDLGPTR